MKAEDIDPIIHSLVHRLHDPSLDAHLINMLGFRSDVRRMPFTETRLRRGSHGHRSPPRILIQRIPAQRFDCLRRTSFAHLFPAQGYFASELNLLDSFGDGAAAVIVTGKQSSGPKNSFGGNLTPFQILLAPWLRPSRFRLSHSSFERRSGNDWLPIRELRGLLLQAPRPYAR